MEKLRGAGADWGAAEPDEEAVAEQESQHGGEGQGLADVFFYLHVIVDHAGEGGDVGKAVEGAPAFAAEAFDHGVGGGDGQRDHD